MILESFTCNACQKEIRIAYEPPTLPHKVESGPIPSPRTLRHCEGGPVLTQAVSRLISFREKREGKWVDVKPLTTDF